MLPRVILHNAVSVDGHTDWFVPDIGMLYRPISLWKEDAILCGSNTILDAAKQEAEEDHKMSGKLKDIPKDQKPLLVIVDSQGRIYNWHFWKNQPHWRSIMVLCSRLTPREYIKYLQKRHIDYIISGVDHVDLRVALEELHNQYKVKVVRVDSGGTLNGVLLRAGLVDEVSVLISPYLVGGLTPRSIFRTNDLDSKSGVIKLKLNHIEELESNLVWLIYEVVK